MYDDSEISSKLKDLTTLYEITKELASSQDLSDSLQKIMHILASMKSMENGTVTIINPKTGKLEIEVAHGLSEEKRLRGKYTIGEGITGRVVATGQPIIVPQISKEPLFLNKTGARADAIDQQRSFLCVPIKHGEQVIGALSIDRFYEGGLTQQANTDLQFLTVLSGLIAESAVRIQIVNQEKETLYSENLKLKRELSEKTV